MHSTKNLTLSARLHALSAWRPSADLLMVYFSLLNALYLLWMAGLKLNQTESAAVLKWWHDSGLWQALAGSLSDQWVIGASIAFELIAGICLLAYARRRAMLVGAVMASLVYGFNLLYMLTNPVWVDAMGGFPFIGSGQGVIKYLPMLATSIYLIAHGLDAPRLVRLSVWLGRIGVLLVMCWIGTMKFFLFEAQGIEPLLRNHWVFSWMYKVWGLQGVSNVIGLTELAFALLVALSWWKHALAPLALAVIGVTVACTASFMFTLPGWNADAAFPVLNRSGIFFLKDQFLLAATLLLLLGTRKVPTLRP